MKPAPLQLLDYFITRLHLEANPDYDRKADADADLDTIQVTQSVSALDSKLEEGSMWLVSMSIKQDIPDDRNIPYCFELELQGEVFAFPVFEGKRLETVVKANAPAMLFGAAREIIRAATGRGPFPAVVIPSTNFLTPPPKKKTAKRVATKKAVAKKAAKKKTTRKKS